MPDLTKRPFTAARAAAGAIVACLLWSSAFAVVKIGLAYVRPLTFAGVRFTLAGCVLIPLSGRPAMILVAIRRHWRLIAAVGFLHTVVLYGAFFLGMSLVRGAQGAVLCGASPLVSALLAHFLMHDDRMTLPKAGCIALGMVGVVILAAASRPWSPAGRWELAGMGLLMIGVLSSAMSGILVARHRRAVNPLLLAGAQMALGGLVLLALALAVEPLPTSLPPVEFLAALVWLAAVSATGISIWFHLLKRVKVSRLNMWKFLIPLFGAVLSWALVPGESPDWATAAGMVCVASAVLLAQLQAVRADRAAAPADRSSPHH